jgi:hypothetical protein
VLDAPRMGLALREGVAADDVNQVLEEIEASENSP